MTQPLLLLKHLGVVLQRCVTHEWCVLLLEDDGTLAPLAAEPATACLSPAIRQVDRSDPAAIRDAFQSQIGAFYDLTGRVPTPMDSHHHLHRCAEILPVFRALVECVEKGERSRTALVGGIWLCENASTQR